MSDIYIPGVRSRLNSEKIVEDLMKLERVPIQRAEQTIVRYETERAYWQDVAVRTTALRESARQLFSFQNPFNERSINSSDESIITGTATRESSEQLLNFTVKQLAQADRLLSKPVEENFQVESGNYTFTIGKDEITFDFRGGTLKEFSDTLNRRNQGKIQSSLIAVRSGTRSLLIESKIPGEDNRLVFSGASLALGEKIGMVSAVYDDNNTLVDVKPLNAVSSAKDAVLSMEGIEIYRSGNEIDDLIPGVTISLKGVSDRPVTLQVEPNTESIKDSIITMVGNYNRLMAELNILTRNDSTVINELTYLTREEKDAYSERLGAFSGDSTLMQIRNGLLRIVTSPHDTSDEYDLSLLAQIGISTDIRMGGGVDASRLRGYLDIDPKVLDSAIASNLPAIKQLFAYDSTGDLLADSGVAYSIDRLVRPYVETGGLFAQKTSTMSSRIDQEKRRIETLDRQLLAKEADLKKQYSMMEGAYARMEQMSSSFDRFQQQNSPR